MKGKTILGVILTISLLSIIIGAGYTGAFFSDTETSAGNTFSAGTLNLQVGDDDPVEWKLDENVMPGDSGGENISVENTGTLDGFLHINFTNPLNDDVTCTEPENNSNDPECNTTGIPGAGELAENLFITVYFDRDGSENFTNDDTLIYMGMVNNTTTSIIQAKLVDSELLGGNKENFRIDWSLDGPGVGNEVQSDLVKFDIPFELTQNPKTVMDGLVGYWTLNEKGDTAYDLSGNNNDGTIHGATLTNGVSGGALSFDSDTGREYISGSPIVIHNKLTLEAWINPSTYPPERSTIILGRSAYYLSLSNDGSLQCYWYGMTPPGYHSSGVSTVPLNQWSHVVATWDGSKVRLYIDGTEKKEISVTGTGNTATNLIIGAETDYRQFNGKIDEIRIYDRALTPAEIQQNFDAIK